MKELFVDYTIALALKEKGFNEDCLAAFMVHRESKVVSAIENEYWYNQNIAQWEPAEPKLNAPLYQQVVDWLRDVKYINIETHYDYITFDATIYDFKNSNVIKLQSSLSEQSPYCFTGYYQALSAAIEKALTLI